MNIAFILKSNLSQLFASIIIFPLCFSPLDNDSLNQINFHKYLNLQKL